MTPRLIHPITVEITQIDPAHTPAADPDYREPTGAPVYKSGVQVRAQLGMERTTQAYRQRPQGDDPQSDGHLLFLVSDLARAGVTLHKGDRVTKLYAGTSQEFRPIRWTVVQVDPTMHDGRGRHLGWAAFFRDEKTLAEVV